MRKHCCSAGSFFTLNGQLLVMIKTLLLILLTVTSSTSRVEAQVNLPPGIEVPALFAYGDSVADTGNNNDIVTVIAQADYLPYGKDFMGGNMPTGRFSNGRIAPDLIAEALGIKKFLPPYLDSNLKPDELLTGVNFASAGSGFDPLTAQVLLAIPLTKQLDLFKEYIERLKSLVGENQTSFIISNSLYFITAGNTDITITYLDTSLRRIQYNDSSYADFLVNGASSFIKELYELGARRFAVLGGLPIGCYPLQRTLPSGGLPTGCLLPIQGLLNGELPIGCLLETVGDALNRQCVANNNRVAQMFNSKLAKETEDLRTELANSTPIFLDVYNTTLDIINNPSKYGIEVVNKGCCGTGLVEFSLLCNKLAPVCPDRDKYLFWDGVHLTEAGYEIIINSVVDKISTQIV